MRNISILAKLCFSAMIGIAPWPDSSKANPKYDFKDSKIGRYDSHQQKKSGLSNHLYLLKLLTL